MTGEGGGVSSDAIIAAALGGQEDEVTCRLHFTLPFNPTHLSRFHLSHAPSPPGCPTATAHSFQLRLESNARRDHPSHQVMHCHGPRPREQRALSRPTVLSQNRIFPNFAHFLRVLAYIPLRVFPPPFKSCKPATCVCVMCVSDWLGLRVWGSAIMLRRSDFQRNTVFKVQGLSFLIDFGGFGFNV